jgi:murein DD-endopeptidase MepM/ murein hydrolase activator NlpD
VQHVRTGVVPRRLIVPVLLLGAATVGFGGLAVIAPPTTPTQANAVAYTDAAPAPALAPEQTDGERATARASRSRRLSEAESAARAAAAAAAQAEAEARARADAERAKAEAEARAKAEARARAEAQARARAESEARAKAEAEARAKAEAAAKAAAKAQADKAAAQKAAAAPSRRGACPVPNATFTDTYGAARSGGRAHRGTDLLAPHGSPVYAVVSGRIRTASSSLGGISLYLDGDNGETYFYAHNSANVARTGQRVGPGDLIARVGSTGNAGGTNHVHFEREVGGRSVNPYEFLRRLC